MQYYLSTNEIEKLTDGLKAAMSIPFIDDIEDFILEAIWEYTKDIEGIDPFFNIRSKLLYDVVDKENRIGWSVKSLQWAFRHHCEFELVVQRSDVYKKSINLGFPALNNDSDPNLIGAALLTHWNHKIETDATIQGVQSKRIMVLLKTIDKKRFAILEEDIHQYNVNDIAWQWTNEQHNGLQGIRKNDGRCIYRWYPSQKQFFERFVLPDTTQMLYIDPKRLTKQEIVNIILPHLQ